MSYAQPLSTLAPEYIGQLQPVGPMKPQETVIVQVVVEEASLEIDECPLKNDDCPPKDEDYPPKYDECHKKPKCPEKELCPPKEKCEKPCAKGREMGYGWGWLGALILWFIIFTVLFWLIYYSLKPSFVLQTDSNQVDTAKVLLAAVISALILVIIIWLIKAAVSRRY